MKRTALLTLMTTLAFNAMAIDHSVFTELLSDHVKDGMVNYQALKNDQRLPQYLDQVAKTDPETIQDDAERLAFWINAYNAYTLQLIVDNYPVESINDLGEGGLVFGSIAKTTAWDKDIVVVNGEELTLNDIEHRIIRRRFEEPRIHFALVCAARSCPPLRAEAYLGQQLDAQLTDQARTFLANSEKNRFHLRIKRADISSIFKWYRSDFGKSKQALLEAIAPYVPDEVKDEIIANAGDWKVKYLKYDWSLNKQ